MTDQRGTKAFRMTVVGCSGSFPGPESPASCYLVQAEAEGRTWSIVVDLGNGALGALQRYVDLLAVDAVLLSHLHTDHCLDMSSYQVFRKWHPSGRAPALPVWGPAGTGTRLHRAYDMPTLPGQEDEFLVREYDGPFEVGPFRIRPVPVDHPVPAYGLRIEVDDHVLAYTGDTGPTPVLLDLAADADLLLSEASFRATDDNPPGIHLTGAEAGETAVKAGAKRLVLTHVPPWHDPQVMLAEAVAVYDGPTELAACGTVYPIG
ncbi:MBL fold metallo-hydrolase [Nocardioides sp. TF02-7]|uniref:MBL fold metallo-hydrolase n=1 Tax=Nocardioides sp. TF02-7 TaxID=2917724 RepID=UPI001F0512C6|nr:MBL fold metallo-hydrolase [Nocardioides sp. TF02-7]UMG91652.1 MBL fold metallo-hydrolase [Nocardioides sp. TF02-7]